MNNLQRTNRNIYPNSSNFDHEHGSSKDMSGDVRPKFDAIYFFFLKKKQGKISFILVYLNADLVEIKCFNFLHAFLNVGFGKELFRSLADAQSVAQHPAVNGFGRMGHEGSTFEIRLREKIGKRATVIQMETEKRDSI